MLPSLAKISPNLSMVAQEAGQVRALRPSDVPQVAGLYIRAYLGKKEPPTRELCDYFERVFFSDPWMEIDASPSLVFVDNEGSILGFIGAHPRRFLCGDRKITAVMMGQLMVDPSKQHRRIAWKLGETLVAGPQALTYGTTASVPAASMWRRIGFWNPPFAGLKWSTNPASTGTRSRSTGWRSPFRTVADSVKAFIKQSGPGHARRIREKGGHGPPYSCRMMGGPEELCLLHRSILGGFAMRPDLDAKHATWLWHMLADSPKMGRLNSCVMVDVNDQPVGWTLYALNDHRIAQVLEIAYAPDRCSDVLEAFFHQAVERGCNRVRGNCTTPELTAAVVELGATLNVVDSGGVFHCKDPDVQSALLNGQAFFSELDSESWLDFASR